MENKYYTPQIDEFYVGFECEIVNNADAQLRYFPAVLDLLFLSKLKSIAIDRNIRVKCLDRKDIESFGFEYGEVVGKTSNEIYFSNTLKDNRGDGNYFLILSKLGWVMIYRTGNLKEDNTLENIVRFSGNIKNKSELVKIMAMLNVK